MPAPVIAAIIAAGTTAGATVYSVKKSQQAADAQSKSAADALAFQKQQAEADFQNTETTRHANYDQWVAAQHRLSTLGDLLGLGPREIPDYVPGKDPNFSQAGPGSPPTPAGGPSGATSPTGQGSRPSDLNAALQAANTIAYGGQPKHTDPAYWQALWQKDPDYAWRRMLGEGAGGNDVATTGPYAGQGGGTTTKSSTTASPYAPLTTYLTPSYQRQPITPGLSMPGGY